MLYFEVSSECNCLLNFGLTPYVMTVLYPGNSLVILNSRTKRDYNESVEWRRKTKSSNDDAPKINSLYLLLQALYRVRCLRQGERRNQRL